MSRRPGPGPYARAVEEALSRLRGRPVLLSPREWSLVSDWHAREIPLGTVLEVLDELAARARARGTAFRSLVYAAPAVEEAWEEVKAVRGGAAAAAAGAGEPSSAAEAWRRRKLTLPRDSALRALLHDLLGRRAAGEDPTALDAALDARLEDLLPPGDVDAVRAAVAGELAPLRARMAPGDWEETARRTRIDRLRAAAGLPRLALDV